MAEWELRHFVCSLADMGGRRVYFFHNVWGQIRAMSIQRKSNMAFWESWESPIFGRSRSLYTSSWDIFWDICEMTRGLHPGPFFFFSWDWGNPLVSDTVAYMALLSKHGQNPRITWALDGLNRYLRFWLPYPISQMSPWNLMKFQRGELGNPRKPSDPWTCRHPSPTWRTWGLQEQVLDQHAACHEHHRHLGKQLDDAWKERSWLKSARVQACCLFLGV